MRLLLANPAGLWALLAIPAILAIHFLQERSRRVRVATLFLLDRVKPESTGGARFERLRQSVPLWLQLLAALLIAWMLAEPRWIKDDSRQTVAVVLDSSVSMSAFKEPTRALMAEKLRAWARAASQTEWHLLESDPRKPTLYTGSDLAALLTAFDGWEPGLGSHRPDDALTVAGGLVKEHGVVIFVTDREIEVSSEVAVLSAGHEMENVGFAGVEVDLVSDAGEGPTGMKWRALVRNYSKEAVTRTWTVEREGAEAGTGGVSSLTLEPGQTRALSGEFPSQVERATLVLSGDKFTWDDRLPLQKPARRQVKVDFQSGSPAGLTLKKMLTSLEGVQAHVGADPVRPDLTIAELGSPATTDAIQLLSGTGENVALDGGWTVAEEHPLTRDLNWMGLLTPRPMEISLTSQDEPLLWKESRPLAVLRHDKNADGDPVRRLLLAWDLSQSNAARHPAVLVLLHRFVEEVRQAKMEPWAGNFEIGQSIEMPFERTGADSKNGFLRYGGTRTPYAGRTPEEVGFFEVEQGETVMLHGAVHFADTREADFRQAGPVDTVDQRRWEAALKQTEADPLTALWVLVVLGCLLGSWGWKSRGQSSAPAWLEASPKVSGRA